MHPVPNLLITTSMCYNQNLCVCVFYARKKIGIKQFLIYQFHRYISLENSAGTRAEMLALRGHASLVQGHHY